MFSCYECNKKLYTPDEYYIVADDVSDYPVCETCFDDIQG